MIICNSMAAPKDHNAERKLLTCNSIVDNIDRIFSEGFKPTDQDMLHVSIRTTGIAGTLLGSDQARCNFNIFDIAGARAASNIWAHDFENVHALVFVASLSEFDKRLIEDQISVSMTLHTDYKDPQTN